MWTMRKRLSEKRNDRLCLYLYRTDELIQRAIREQFIDCTVLTIAHRLRTVIDSDRILVRESFFELKWNHAVGCFQVLDHGEVMEYDEAKVLLSRSSSYFSSLVDQTGPTEANYLRHLAAATKTIVTGNESTVQMDEFDAVAAEDEPLLPR